MAGEHGDPLEIPEFLKIPQEERRAAWEQHRKTAKPLPAAPDDNWRQERNRAYDEAARREPSNGDHGPKS